MQAARYKYPCLTYRGFLALIEGVEPRSSNFSALLNDYKAFLDRELDNLELISRRYKGDTGVALPAADYAGAGYSDNDLRFFNLQYLGELMDMLARDPNWKNVDWDAKIESGGPWLASSGTSTHPWKAELAQAAVNEAQLWFQIGIGPGPSGIFASKGKRAAELQLKYAARSREQIEKARRLVNRSKPAGGIRQTRTGQWYVTVLERLAVKESEMQFADMVQRINEFALQFWEVQR